MAIKKVTLKRWNGSEWEPILPVTNHIGEVLVLHAHGTTYEVETTVREMSFEEEMEQERLLFFNQDGKVLCK